MEPDLPGEPVVEREGEWAGGAAQELAAEREEWQGPGPASAREENACAPNAGQPPLTRRARLVIK